MILRFIYSYRKDRNVDTETGWIIVLKTLTFSWCLQVRLSVTLKTFKLSRCLLVRISQRL